MNERRVFLGWDQPCLPSAAKWLRDRYETATSYDMSKVIIVLPGARAGRRLLEYLTQAAGIFVPPRIITLGQLPELLYESEVAVASPLQSLLTRAHALRSGQREILEAIVPQPPEDDDLLGWLALARDLAKLDDELAGESLTVDDVITQCEKQVDFNDAPRWQALAQLHQAYRSSLGARNYCDQNMAHAAAISQKRCTTDGDIILLSLTDLNRMVRQMLTPLSEHVTCLIHAPQSERDAFDQWGCVTPAHWAERFIDVPESMIHVVSQPRDQSMLVARLLDPMLDGGHASADSTRAISEQFHPTQITIGLGDDSLAGAVQRTLALSNLPTHWAAGRPIAQSRPGLLLTSLAAYIRHQRTDDFASLLRHPDIERYLLATATGAHDIIEHWLTLLDRYISEHLASRHTGDWLGDSENALKLKQIHDAIHALLPEHPQLRRSLPAWSQAIADLLRQVYAHASLNPQNREDGDLIRTLEMIANALREQEELDPQDPTTPMLSFADAIALTTSLIASEATPTADEPSGSAIELLGWLELVLDDAPALIITGFNEHHIPQSTSGDAFLPDHLRKSLGLVDSARRYARDAAALTAMLHSKKHLALIAGRRGHDDEPLAPSRLLLTGSADMLAQRILHFYPKDHEAVGQGNHALFALAGGNRFLIPAPKLPTKPIERMSVTWFKDYLACPYRFYLKHIEKLRAIDDHCVELDGMTFGSIAHEVLNQFGKSEQRDSMNPAEIAAFLKDHLHDVAGQLLGDEPPIAARLQLMQLEQRLDAFAPQQANMVRDGWHILPEMIECSAQSIFETEHGKVTVHGRIDRIDRHESGRYRIIDYKTGDSGKTPEETHRQGPKDNKAWTDLQLPLYHHMASALNIVGDIELGYVLLPKRIEAVNFVPAPWSRMDIDEATGLAQQIITNIQSGIFWPPSEPPQYEDDLAALCMDGYDSRAAIIQQVTRQMEGES